MGSLVTLSEVNGLLNNLPSIFELYNSLYHGVRLFNFDNYIKSKFTLNINPIYLVETSNQTGVGPESKGKNVDTSHSNQNPPKSRSNSPGSNISDTEY